MFWGKCKLTYQQSLHILNCFYFHPLLSGFWTSEAMVLNSILGCLVVHPAVLEKNVLPPNRIWTSELWLTVPAAAYKNRYIPPLLQGAISNPLTNVYDRVLKFRWTLQPKLPMGDLLGWFVPDKYHSLRGKIPMSKTGIKLWFSQLWSQHHLAQWQHSTSAVLT